MTQSAHSPSFSAARRASTHSIALFPVPMIIGTNYVRFPQGRTRGKSSVRSVSPSLVKIPAQSGVKVGEKRTDKGVILGQIIALFCKNGASDTCPARKARQLLPESSADSASKLLQLLLQSCCNFYPKVAATLDHKLLTGPHPTTPRPPTSPPPPAGAAPPPNPPPPVCIINDGTQAVGSGSLVFLAGGSSLAT